ncbi:tyrosine-type recombinase/integrase [Nonomuraea aurantiaca]|uniref:tyrosine-type recombinase/integrase n=1 Tax=Nonomuraea aurantiaca TaxID=2878562 RepID=UPI001CD9BBFC|nr:tyrosine-type recombinase/integrase [Nonomuraea aurantiaca]MCA2220014.1 tyrosine-type recombinase/integrase [Nonomuraea aurantiaca]
MRIRLIDAEKDHHDVSLLARVLGVSRQGYYAWDADVLKPAVFSAGAPTDMTFHDLRHTFASTALAEDVPISEVSRWLGHESITTVDLYGHLVPEASERARTALDHAFAVAGGLA